MKSQYVPGGRAGQTGCCGLSRCADRAWTRSQVIHKQRLRANDRAHPTGELTAQHPVWPGLLQAGQFDDLSTLEGGKSQSDVPTAWVGPGGKITPGVRNGGRCDARSIRHTESRRPRVGSGPHERSPRGCGHAGLDTKAGPGCLRFAEGAVDRQERSRLDAVFGHAWAKLLAERGLVFQHSSGPLISGITYGQGH